MKNPVLLPSLLALVPLLACAPTYSPGQSVTLSDGEICTVLGPGAEGTQLDCPTRGRLIADIRTPNINDQLNPELAPGIRLSDVPGVPNIPTIPQTTAEAQCRAGQYAQNRVRGAAEEAVLSAAGLPGNTLGIIRRSQRIATQLEGRSLPPSVDPCTGL